MLFQPYADICIYVYIKKEKHLSPISDGAEISASKGSYVAIGEID